MIADKEQDIPFQEAVSKAGKTNNLANRETVMLVVRTALGEAMMRRGRGLSLIAGRVANILLGSDQHYIPARNWNAPGHIDEFVAKWAGSSETTPVGRVSHAFVRLVEDVLDVADYAGKPGVLREQWDWQVEALLDHYVGIFMGISPPAQAIMALGEQEPSTLVEDEDDIGAIESRTNRAFCPTGPGGGVDNSCGPRSGGIGSTVPQPGETGSDAAIQQSYIDDAKNLYSSDWMRDRGERYMQKMADQDVRLSKVQSAVAGLHDKSERLSAKHDKECKKLEELMDAKAPKEEIDAQAAKVDEALDKFFKHKKSFNEKAWKEIKKGVVASGGEQIKRVSFETYDLSVDQAVDVGRLQDRLSGVMSTRLQQRIDETKVRSIPEGERQRPYFKGERHGGEDKSIYLNKHPGEATVAHELGHSLESNANVHAMTTGFLYTRVANETPKYMGDGYDKWEMGRDDDFEKAFGGSARYVGKHYKSDDTEVLSMGLEQLVTDPVYFARKDPEYFKLVVAILDGSVI